MKLRTYLQREKLTATAFGLRVGVSHAAIVRYMNGTRRPEWAVLDRIIKETGGEVSPDDFVPEGYTPPPPPPPDDPDRGILIRDPHTAPDPAAYTAEMADWVAGRRGRKIAPDLVDTALKTLGKPGGEAA